MQWLRRTWKAPGGGLRAARLKDAVYRARFVRWIVARSLSLLRRYPILLSPARRALKLLPLRVSAPLRRYHYKWMMSQVELPPSLGQGPRKISRKGRAPDWDRLLPYAEKGQLTKGWYGGRELRSKETYSATPLPPRAILRLAEDAYQAGTQRIEERYLYGQSLPEEKPLYLRYTPFDRYRRFLASRSVPDSVRKMPACGGFTVVTPFHRHLEFFEAAAASVDRLLFPDEENRAAFEWLVVNDDPLISWEDLARRIPERLLPVVRNIRPDGNGGIVDALNSGLRHGRYRWFLFLDCDDEIEPNALAVLNHYIERFPRCRYISSSITDIDEYGTVLRFRGNEHPVDRLLDIGMLAGHLKAIRRDLFEDIGYLDPRFEFCQDYEYALRVAINEPILKIPEPLYRYRWHEETQSVSRAGRQKAAHDRIQRQYLRRFLDRREEVELSRKEAKSRAVERPPSLFHAPLHGAVIVRTQNKRPQLLSEAVESVSIQAPSLTPIVVVHGSDDDLRDVERQLRGKGDIVFLLASERCNPGKRLGYPANVAIDYMKERPETFHYIAFLDDDDILYPHFSSQIGEALRWSGADLVYAMSNKRWLPRPAEPGPSPLPDSCLISENFIPCNSYGLATPFLRHSGIRFDEDMLYLDDWDFLLSLWNAGARFQFLPQTVSEFRVVNDGNTVGKRFPELYAQSAARMQLKAWDISLSSEGGPARFRRDMLDFEWPETRVPEKRTVDAAYGIWDRAERVCREQNRLQR